MQQVTHIEFRTAIIYTDSKITLDSIRSAKNHNHLVEEIRKRAVTLNKKNWKIEFKWVKAHAGICGKEIADGLANEATQNYYVTYSTIPKKRYKKGYPERKHKKMVKSMGGNNERSDYQRIFFPSVERRLAVNVNVSPNVTTLMTCHGNIRSYLHRLKILGSPECPSRHGVRTVDHLICQCNRLKNER
jgi:hypothetical protein